MITTCKNCGAENRLPELRHGSTVRCGNCRTELAVFSTPAKAGKMSGTIWAWVAIAAIVLGAWGVNNVKQARASSAPSKGTSSTSNVSSYVSASYPPPGTSPKKPLFTEPEQVLPQHGKITRYTSDEEIAPLEIRSTVGSNYLVKLCDYYSGRNVLTVFVHGGRTANLDVPLGTYKIKYASGDAWYGSEFLFGPDTAYSQADSSFDFRVNGNQISGYTLTLYTVVNGNLETSRIRAKDF